MALELRFWTTGALGEQWQMGSLAAPLASQWALFGGLLLRITLRGKLGAQSEGKALLPQWWHTFLASWVLSPFLSLPLTLTV